MNKDSNFMIVEALDAKLDAMKQLSLLKSVETANETLGILKQAPVYAWSNQMIERVIECAEDFPGESKFHRSWLHQAVGFWWFNHNSPIKIYDTIHEGFVRLHALSYFLDHNNSGTICEVAAYSYDSYTKLPGMSLIDIVPLGEGITVNNMISNIKEYGYKRSSEKKKMTYRDLILLFSAGSLWLNQKIITFDTKIAPRQAAKRAKRMDVSPAINVVKLRTKYNPNAQPQNKDGDVEWSCHWKVQGFWRNQWYPSLQRHIPIWIDEFIKGDLTKPMKIHPETVFKVDR